MESAVRSMASFDEPVLLDKYFHIVVDGDSVKYFNYSGIYREGVGIVTKDKTIPLSLTNYERTQLERTGCV